MCVFVKKTGFLLHTVDMFGDFNRCRYMFVVYIPTFVFFVEMY